MSSLSSEQYSSNNVASDDMHGYGGDFPRGPRKLDSHFDRGYMEQGQQA
jgi:hypothetical protein